MTINWKNLCNQVTLTATPSSVYSAATQTTATIQAVSVSNPTVAPIVVNIQLVLNGGAVGSGLIASKTIPAGKTMGLYDAINHKIPPLASIYADGDGALITMSGAESV